MGLFRDIPKELAAVIATTLSIDEARQRIEDKIRREPTTLRTAFTQGNRERVFDGSITDNGFTIHRTTFRGSSPMPKLTGRFVACDEGTLIEITTKVRSELIERMTLYVVIAIPLYVMIIFFCLRGGDILPGIPIATLFIGGGFIVKLLFNRSALIGGFARERTYLARLLSAS